jgi:hypothetical protein
VTNLNTAISQLPAVSSTSTTSTRSTNTSNVVESLGSFLADASSSATSALPHIQELANQLQSESSLQDSTTRNQVQQQAHAIAPILQQLGSLFIMLSTSLSTVQMGNAPGLLLLVNY